MVEQSILENSNIQNDVRNYKRERILEAAQQLFYEKGYSNTTMEELASTLGVTKPFVYRYFKNKEALLIAIYESLANRISGILFDALKMPVTPDVQLATFIREFALENMKSVSVGIVYIQEETNLDPEFRASINEQHKKFDKALAGLIRSGVEQGYFRTDDPYIAGLGLIGMVRWVQRWYRPHGQASKEAIANIFVEMALASIHFRPPEEKVKENIQGT